MKNSIQVKSTKKVRESVKAVDNKKLRNDTIYKT